jgi:proline iminopeptidase
LPDARSSAHQEGYIDVGDGVRLFYRVVGTRGDTVVVLHGGPGFSMSYLAPELEPLAAEHVLLFYDQRGAGRSTLVADSASLDAQRFVDDLEVVRSHFGLDRLALLGHSWGAALAALYAVQHPERVERFLLINPGAISYALETRAFMILDGRRATDSQGLLRQLEAAYLADPADAAACRAFYDLFFSAAFADTVAQRRSRGDFCAGSPEALANKVVHVDRFTIASLGEWDWRPVMGEATAPALVVHGAADAVPLESACEWLTALPNARLLVLEKSGHFSYLDTPAPFFAAARAFLRGEWPADAQTGSAAAARCVL